ncbi:MAG: nucleotidyltransferase domain-containing protein [Planctomycetota bacterium]
MLRWPEPRQVDEAARSWAAREAPRHPGLIRIGYFGSYARGDAGVGSDLDLVALVEAAAEPFASRGVAWELESLPVPAEILVYTRAEWDRLREGGGRLGAVLAHETVWVWPATPPGG